jgi:hypothetical protein
MRFLPVLLLCLFTGAVGAQVIETKLNYNFEPTEYTARYFSQMTPKGDSGWFRQVWFVPEGSMAMQGWYADRDAKIPNGRQTWWHATTYPSSTGNYVQGKLDGPWLKFDEKGTLTDSLNYRAGYYMGPQYKWTKDGYLADSAWFDGAGNGTSVSWDADGKLFSAGRLVRDTARVGKWVYYRPDGGVLATEIYNDGKRISCTCFSPDGTALDSAACAEREASFPGGAAAWSRFVSRNLDANLPSRMGAPRGQYTVVMQFLVDTDGSVVEIKPLSKNGFGMEDALIHLLKKSPKWETARQFGRAVKAYRKQPVTFVVQ